jgi:hypothetical protein
MSTGPMLKMAIIDQARLRTNLAKIQGITLYMQAAQDITIGGRLSKTQCRHFQSTPDRS